MSWWRKEGEGRELVARFAPDFSHRECLARAVTLRRQGRPPELLQSPEKATNHTIQLVYEYVQLCNELEVERNSTYC